MLCLLYIHFFQNKAIAIDRVIDCLNSSDITILEQLEKRTNSKPEEGASLLDSWFSVWRTTTVTASWSWFTQTNYYNIMDSQFRREGRMVVIIDKAWREDAQNLPFDDIQVPLMELPDPEPDNGNTSETLKEQEMKWLDLELQRITASESQPSQTGNHWFPNCICSHSIKIVLQPNSQLDLLQHAFIDQEENNVFGYKIVHLYSFCVCYSHVMYIRNHKIDCRNFFTPIIFPKITPDYSLRYKIWPPRQRHQLDSSFSNGN